MKLAKYNLDDRGIQYIAYSLKSGYSLANEALKEVNLEKGKSYTYLPETISKESLYEFDYGGKFVVENGSNSYANSPIYMNDFLANKIYKYVTINKKNRVIFEDYMRRKGDKNLTKIDTNYFTINDKVYHYVNYTDDIEKIRDTIKIASNIPHYLIFFCNNFIKNGERKYNDIEKIGSAAYDGESYIFWKK